MRQYKDSSAMAGRGSLILLKKLMLDHLLQTRVPDNGFSQSTAGALVANIIAHTYCRNNYIASPGAREPDITWKRGYGNSAGLMLAMAVLEPVTTTRRSHNQFLQTDHFTTLFQD